MVELIEQRTPAVETVAVLRGGRYGETPLGLAYAITRLPVPYDPADLRSEAVQALKAADRPAAEVAFFERICDARRLGAAEPPLVGADPAFPAALAASALTDEQLGHVRERLTARRRLNATGVGTVMTLLGAAGDLRSYSRVLSALARAVPHLFEVGDPDLAMWVLREFTKRVESSDKPWPELEQRLTEAHEVACGTRSLAALLVLSSNNPQAVEYAKELVSLGGDNAARGMATAALASDDENAMEFAEAVLGRRLPELLAPEAPHVDAKRAAKLAQLFAGAGGPWCMQALGQLVARPEDRVRSETARGIAAGGGEAAAVYLPRLLRDSSDSVVKVTVHVMTRHAIPGAAEMLARRLEEIDSDREIGTAREIIGALATSPSPAAEAALRQLAEKGGFLRKGKSAELRKAAQEALAARKAGGL